MSRPQSFAHCCCWAAAGLVLVLLLLLLSLSLLLVVVVLLLPHRLLLEICRETFVDGKTVVTTGARAAGGAGNSDPSSQPEAGDGGGARKLQGRDASGRGLRDGRDLVEGNQTAANRGCEGLARGKGDSRSLSHGFESHHGIKCGLSSNMLFLVLFSLHHPT